MTIDISTDKSYLGTPSNNFDFTNVEVLDNWRIVDEK
jgi:hypothetical protein